MLSFYYNFFSLDGKKIVQFLFSEELLSVHGLILVSIYAPTKVDLTCHEKVFFTLQSQKRNINLFAEIVFLRL